MFRVLNVANADVLLTVTARLVVSFNEGITGVRTHIMTYDRKEKSTDLVLRLERSPYMVMVDHGAKETLLAGVNLSS